MLDNLEGAFLCANDSFCRWRGRLPAHSGGKVHCGFADPVRNCITSSLLNSIFFSVARLAFISAAGFLLRKRRKAPRDQP
ncbi:LPXTG cell wall anchor domain-containing protein [Agrobacterium salinitolerans]|uniref:LPXTG cell wall anchor domain-containing protein n=1 Tax=Agrobacterium salinitolerans TaxID=1183413 RepID=A0ABY3BRV9_9HYPH|nr:LPXTG cell wall anchor domain-containing protein [Agrobacterium salinitolerans]